MSRQRKLVIGGALAAIAIVGVVILLAATSVMKRPAPPSPVEIVPMVWKTARETPMHTLHVGQQKIACTECHRTGDTTKDAASAETDAPPAPASAAVCVTCHANEEKTHHVGGARTAATATDPAPPPKTTTDCLSCHVFGANKATAQCTDCHAGRLPQHATREATCNQCHAMHAPTKNKVRFEQGRQADANANAAAQAQAPMADCRSCHPNAKATHGPSVIIPVLATDGGVALADVHATQVCSSCHKPHTKKEAANGACASCHVAAAANANANANAIGTMSSSTSAPTISLRGPRVASHEACVTCHQPHDVRRDAARAGCVTCHANRAAAVSNDEHRACTTCHAPHAPNRELARASCTASAGCHNATALHTSGGGGDGNGGMFGTKRDIKEHAECINCHDPHRPHDASVKPGEACTTRCHASTSSTHPVSARDHDLGRGPCISCHVPHASAERAKPTCTASSCHGGSAGGGGLHALTSDRDAHAKGRVNCIDCHKPHAFKLAPLTASTTTAAAASPSPTLCANCHVTQAAKANAVHSSSGALGSHAQCTACHGGSATAHAPVAKPTLPSTCASCHAAEVTSAPRAHAQACTTCHDAHSGKLLQRAADGSNKPMCTTSCHADKKNALHAKASGGLGTGSSSGSGSGSASASASAETCSSCHRAHGPKGIDTPPACTTCHAQAKLAGLHQVKGHSSATTTTAGGASSCTKCHSSHAEPRSDRATCTSSSCHTDRQNHQPDAKMCKGCHIFKR